MHGREDRQHELLERIVDGAPIVMLVVDALGTITFCSDAAERLFGFTTVELIGTNILDYIDFDWNPLAIESIGSALESSGLRNPMMFRMRCKDGTLRIVEVTANSQVDHPVTQGMAAYIRVWDDQAKLDEIIDALAGENSLENKFESFVELMAGETLSAVAAVLFEAHEGRFTRAVAAPGLAPLLGLGSEAGPLDGRADPDLSDALLPWNQALDTGADQLVPVSDLPPLQRQIAAAAGYRWCWAIPVCANDGVTRACLVMWRPSAAPMEEAYLVLIRRLVRLTHLVLDQDESRRRLLHAANHDPLTNLANRAAFFDRHQDSLVDARTGACTAVLYLDLDGFKPVNDRLGHGAGDAVLVAIARRLSARVRAGDLVARMGGDEFAVLCLDVSSVAEVEILAGRLAAAAREPVTVGAETLEVGASVGVCVAPAGEFSLDALIEAADAALYEVKAGKAGGWRVRALGDAALR